MPHKSSLKQESELKKIKRNEQNDLAGFQEAQQPEVEFVWNPP